MKNLFLFVLILAAPALRAQYYYNDIVTTEETNRQMKNYLANRVRSVNAIGFDQRGVRATDFSELQEVKENGRALKITSETNTSYTIFYNRFDEQSRLISVIDSSSAVKSVTNYEYDASGRISRIKNTTRDSANDFNQVEEHSWHYGTDNKPLKMWRIINGTDSLEIRFSPDEDGNTGDEKTFRRGVETGTVYYYYDHKKRLTDVVRYNTKLKRLMPDMMFEYDNNDRVVQKITTTSSLSLGYLIWRYVFDANGLKTKEALFNHEKEITGKIEYSYTYGQ